VFFFCFVEGNAATRGPWATGPQVKTKGWTQDTAVGFDHKPCGESHFRRRRHRPTPSRPPEWNWAKARWSLDSFSDSMALEPCSEMFLLSNKSFRAAQHSYASISHVFFFILSRSIATSHKKYSKKQKQIHDFPSYALSSSIDKNSSSYCHMKGLMVESPSIKSVD